MEHLLEAVLTAGVIFGMVFAFIGFIATARWTYLKLRGD